MVGSLSSTLPFLMLSVAQMADVLPQHIYNLATLTGGVTSYCFKNNKEMFQFLSGNTDFQQMMNTKLEHWVWEHQPTYYVYTVEADKPSLHGKRLQGGRQYRGKCYLITQLSRDVKRQRTDKDVKIECICSEAFISSGSGAYVEKVDGTLHVQQKTLNLLACRSHSNFDTYTTQYG